jgi:AraC-like DNA-binding protein
VRHYWVVDCEVERPITEHVYPDGGIGVVFDLGGGTSINARTPAEPCFFDGIHSAAGRMAFQRRSSCLGVRFLPGGAAFLLSAPVHEIGNEPVPITEIAGSELERTFERLHASDSARARLSIVEEWLRKLRSRARRHPDLSPALLYLAHHPGCSVQKLAGDLGLDLRKLERLFQAQVGMSAKKLARLHRVGAARTLIKTHGELTLTDIGLMAGYYDQAHFIKDFKAVSGMTPGEYQARQRSA